jgi:hypothetical protein
MLCAALPASADPPTVTPALPGGATQVETIRFADPHWSPVRLVKGPSAHRMPPSFPGATTQRLAFGNGEVAVVRGPSAAGAALAPRVETVRFGDAALPAVTIVRGAGRDDAIDLFDPAAGGELDRVAFAVDGAESRHGADPAMWRREFDGPQGPMQVSAAAALDVGGGDRFDLRQNRRLGRAYLATMYRRYGNWPDAVAAYNWGPGNLDQWILSGRSLDRLPLETGRYLLRVLRDALPTGP